MRLRRLNAKNVAETGNAEALPRGTHKSFRAALRAFEERRGTAVSRNRYLGVGYRRRLAMRKQSPLSGLGAAGAQSQGHVRDAASRPLS